MKTLPTYTRAAVKTISARVTLFPTINVRERRCFSSTLSASTRSFFPLDMFLGLGGRNPKIGYTTMQPGTSISFAVQSTQLST